MADNQDGQVQAAIGADHVDNDAENNQVEATTQDTTGVLDVQDHDMVAHGSNNVQVYANNDGDGVRDDPSGDGSGAGSDGDEGDSDDFLMEIEKMMDQDDQETCLNKLFVGVLDFMPFLNHMTQFLDYKSKLAFRQVSRTCNTQVIQHPSFIKKTRITMGKKWYREAIGLNNWGISMKVGELKLERFTYHRKSVVLRSFCDNIRQTLSKLIVTHCSLEYNGFLYFLNKLDCLETLVLCDVRLQAPRSAPNPEESKDREYAKPLKSLTLEKIYLLNNWATSLLVKRTGRLETLILKDLFIKDEKLVKLIAEERTKIREEHEKAKRARRHTHGADQYNKIPRETKDPEKTNEGSTAFFKRLPYLLEANKDSLKKLVLEESADTGLEIAHRFFQVVRESEVELNLSQFHLTYRPQNCLATHIVKFCADCCKNLEVLKLKVVGPFANVVLEEILTADLRQSVRQLVLDFDSNELVSESLNLGSLEGFGKLESFKLIDSKVISKAESVEYNKVYRRVHPKVQQEPNPNRPRRQNRAQQNNQQNGQPPPPVAPQQPEHDQIERITQARNELQAMDQRLGTKCTFNFTQFLKPEIKELCLNNFITNVGDDVVNLFAQVNGAQVLENLTKLELRRSNKIFLKSSPELMVLISTLSKLKSLTLAKMHLNDYDLTGMDLQHCKRLRSTMTHQSILLFTPGQENEGDNEVEKTEFMNYMNGPQFTKVFATLKDLKYLDISGNLKVTDLSLIELAKIPKLKYLNLADNNKITDSGLHYISQNLANLEEINLRNLRRVSEHGMNKLLFGCNKLHSIYTTSIMKNQTDRADSLEYELSKDYDQVLKTPWGENKIKMLDDTEQSDVDDGNDENENDAGANIGNDIAAGANE